MAESKLATIYNVHTMGGETLVIPAYGMEIHEGVNRVHFLNADGSHMQQWIVFLSGVAAITIREPQPVGMGRLTIR